MDIKLKTRVEGVHIWLPVEEAVKFLSSPATVQREVETMLRAGGVNPATGEALEMDFAVALGRRPGLEPVDEPEKKRKYPPKPSTKRKYKKQDKVSCDYCSRMISRGAMGRHIKAAHPEVGESWKPDDEEL